jgi:chromosome segregation ATPase
MKRELILVVSILLVFGLSWVSFGQPEGSSRGPSDTGAASRRGMWRERQQKAISAIEEQVAKMKSGMESFSGRRQSWQNLSDEERNKLREQFRKVREERQESIIIIEEQLAKLKGRRSLQQEHEKSVSEWNTIRESAIKEKATATAANIDKLIAEKKKAFEEKMQTKTQLNGLSPEPAGFNETARVKEARIRRGERQAVSLHPAIDFPRLGVFPSLG